MPRYLLLRMQWRRKGSSRYRRKRSLGLKPKHIRLPSKQTSSRRVSYPRCSLCNSRIITPTISNISCSSSKRRKGWRRNIISRFLIPAWWVRPRIMRSLPRQPSQANNIRGMDRVCQLLKLRPEGTRVHRQSINPLISSQANSSSWVLPNSLQQPLPTKVKQGYISRHRQLTIQRLLNRTFPMSSSGQTSGLGKTQLI